MIVCGARKWIERPAGGGEWRRGVVVGELGGDEVWCMVVHECEGSSMGVLLACARDRVMNNNNNENVCARKGEGARMVVCGASK
jgi:hypothetical protein